MLETPEVHPALMVAMQVAMNDRLSAVTLEAVAHRSGIPLIELCELFEGGPLELKQHAYEAALGVANQLLEETAGRRCSSLTPLQHLSEDMMVLMGAVGDVELVDIIGYMLLYMDHVVSYRAVPSWVKAPNVPPQGPQEQAFRSWMMNRTALTCFNHAVDGSAEAKIAHHCITMVMRQGYLTYFKVHSDLEDNDALLDPGDGIREIEAMISKTVPEMVRLLGS